MKSPIIQACAAGLTVLVILCAFRTQAQPAEVEPASDPEPTPTPVELFCEVTKMVEEAAQMTAEEEEAILLEDDRIEAALLEQGHYRDDIPLTYLEQDYLHTAADEFGIDYYIMVALIDKETDFRNITGDSGSAYGYCQIWPKWWAGLMGEIGAEDLMSPYDNFRTAAAILSQHMERYGSIRDALTAYNTGEPGRSKYASEVLALAEEWRNQ